MKHPFIQELLLFLVPLCGVALVALIMVVMTFWLAGRA